MRRLDALVLTHAQLDHEGMAVPITRTYHPRLVLDGGAGWHTPTQRGLRANVRARARRASSSSSGGIRLRLLWPPRPPPGWRPEGDPNNRAVVAIASVGSFDVLLTADAESDITGPLAAAARRGAQGRPPRQRGPGPARRCSPARSPRSRRSRSAAATPTATPRRPRSARSEPPCRTSYRTDRDGTVRLHVTAAGDRAVERRPLDSAAVPAFKPAYLILGDDHGRIAERRAQAARAGGGRERRLRGRGARGRRVHRRRRRRPR